MPQIGSLANHMNKQCIFVCVNGTNCSFLYLFCRWNEKTGHGQMMDVESSYSDFINCDRTGRRNAVPDIKGEETVVGTSELTKDMAEMDLKAGGWCVCVRVGACVCAWCSPGGLGQATSSASSTSCVYIMQGLRCVFGAG